MCFNLQFGFLQRNPLVLPIIENMEGYQPFDVYISHKIFHRWSIILYLSIVCVYLYQIKCNTIATTSVEIEPSLSYRSITKQYQIIMIGQTKFKIDYKIEFLLQIEMVFFLSNHTWSNSINASSQKTLFENFLHSNSTNTKLPPFPWSTF